jgi:hypothetical protein
MHRLAGPGELAVLDVLEAERTGSEPDQQRVLPMLSPAVQRQSRES